MVQQHPFGPFLPDNIRFIVVGTFPELQFSEATPEENEENKLAFTHGGRSRFWKIMMQIFNVTLKTRDDKKAFLTAQRIGLMDLYAAVDHWNYTNSDKDLHIVKTNKIPFKELFEVDTIEKFYCLGYEIADILKEWFPEKKSKIVGLPSPLSIGRVPFDVKIAAYTAAFIDIE